MWVHYLGAMVGSTVSEEFKGLAAHQVNIDTKAMRKLQPNTTVFGMLETSGEVGAATLAFGVFTRMLSKLG